MLHRVRAVTSCEPLATAIIITTLTETPGNTAAKRKKINDFTE
jgi:hypothetical protein